MSRRCWRAAPPLALAPAVGRAEGVPVIDMAALYRRDVGVELFLESDAVHPNEWGHQLEAEVLHLALAERGVAPPPRASMRRRKPRRRARCRAGIC